MDEAFRLAMSPHRGPVFLDFSLEAIFGQAEAELAEPEPLPVTGPDPGDVSRIADLVRAARRPVLILGSDVWLGGAQDAARQAAEELRLPVVANGQARGVLPRGHDLLVKSFGDVVRRGRLGHAYLFVGPGGVGKRLFARELAKALLCEKSLDKFDSCDTCPACQQVEAGTPVIVKE